MLFDIEIIEYGEKKKMKNYIEMLRYHFLSEGKLYIQFYRSVSENIGQRLSNFGEQ